jgi:hypothetical protein
MPQIETGDAPLPIRLGYEWNTDYDNGYPARRPHASIDHDPQCEFSAGRCGQHVYARRGDPSYDAAIGPRAALWYSVPERSSGRGGWKAAPMGPPLLTPGWQQAYGESAGRHGRAAYRAVANSETGFGLHRSHPSGFNDHYTGAQGTTVQSNAMVTIIGTASDRGGVVGGVEVSTDGGASWHAASGARIGSTQWTPATAGTATILSRAVDDSGNLETSSKSVSAAVAPRYLSLQHLAATAAPSVSAAD